MMGQPHKHAELIKRWADGDDIEQKVFKVNAPSSGSISLSPDFWADFDGKWLDDMEYRIKPESLKYPQTKMQGTDAFDVFYAAMGVRAAKGVLCLTVPPGVDVSIDDGLLAIANAAIARAIEDGDVVPAAMLEKVARAVYDELIAQVEHYSTGCATYISDGIDLAAIIKRVKEGK